MKHYIWILLLLFFACKKEPEGARISIRQQPSVIALSSLDVVSGLEVPVFSFLYAFNVSSGRFDSIVTSTYGSSASSYVFDYAQLNSRQKIVLNFIDSSSVFSELVFDNANYTLTDYTSYTPLQTPKGYKLQYDAYARLKRYDFNSAIVAENYFRGYSYHDDTILVNSQRASDNCFSNDTILSSSYNLDYRIPYLFLIELGVAQHCGSAVFSLLSALPLSNFVYKLPRSIVSGNIRTEYAYSGDQEGRLIGINIIRKAVDANQILNQYKVSISY